jgi:hypothetical protein
MLGSDTWCSPSQLGTVSLRPDALKGVIVRFDIALAAVLGVSLCSCGQPAKQSEPTKQQASETSSSAQALEANLHQTPPPKFRVFKFKSDMPISYVVPVDTTDDQLRNLLWFFRHKVRADDFKAIGITRPISLGDYGYRSGMLLVFRGEKCANEQYLSDAEIQKGNLGPCGYGEHDDAYYQWGIDGDPYKDAAGIKPKNGDNVLVFDYRDNWRASSEALQRVDQNTKEQWKATQEEWEPRQRFAVQITNELNKKV